MRVPVIKAHSNSLEILGFYSRFAEQNIETERLVKEILSSIKNNGLSAAIRYAKKYDGLKNNKLKISKEQIIKAASKIEPKLKKALKQAIDNVRRFHEKQLLDKSWSFRGKDGEILGQKVRPLKRVGLYVPGGAGVYPSTLIMNAIPALVAGVKELVVVSPIKAGLDSSLAFVLKEFGIKEFYHIGGAQAIGLLAYGAKGIAPVDKIIGPGNIFATLAKKEVFGTVDIDMLAGPSEIVVLADANANPAWVAADLLSQAEHGSGLEASVCITDSVRFAKKLADCLEKQIEASPKKAILEKALAKHGLILLVKKMETGVGIVNKIAPEHLQIIAKNQDALAEKIENAGAIFIGPYSAESVGDYFAGPNHVLPTNGTARFASPLGVYDFVKRTSIIKYSKNAMLKNAENIAAIAKAEGFYHHAKAVEVRKNY
ncbi:MAG: histidinol dehydrogenase [Fibromonadaceae bacterium]|jgi:histidinol dehydrogenase|nr:histidinol dehydrogenase [Fibromonadaceae bacterium]